jgi:uncharacterized repeat protein (TIGR04076 family)
MYMMKGMTRGEFDVYELRDDEFGLYDLRITTVHLDTSLPLICNHPEGSFYELSGENLSLPDGGTIPIYPLAAVLPILPAKQRMNPSNDWIETDAHVRCPDPCCGGAFHIERTGVTVFRNSEVSGAIGGPNDNRRNAP